MTEFVTCIIPVHNGAATIERAVKSAIDVGCDDVYVFDDASTDNTYHILKNRLIDEYNLLTWLYSSPFHVGVNYARNKMIHETDADDGLIICLDADDTLRSIEPLKQAYSDGFWVYGDHDEHNGDSVQHIKGSPAGSITRKPLTGVTFLFHKKDWQKVGGFDSDFAYAEEYSLQCALTNAGIKPKYVETIVYDRYLSPTGNPRTALATEYWTFYRNMAKRKYPALFAGQG